MSQETVMKFFDSVREDKAVAERLHSADDDLDEFARLSAELGRARGFEFEPSDVRSAIASLMARWQNELTDQQLSAVSGGETPDPCPVPVPSGPVPIPYPNLFFGFGMTAAGTGRRLDVPGPRPGGAKAG